MNDLNKDIERAHRGKINGQGNNNEQSDAIYVKFGSWTISEAIKKEVIKACRIYKWWMSYRTASCFDITCLKTIGWNLEIDSLKNEYSPLLTRCVWVIVTQMYSIATTDIINDKLKIRKDILQKNITWKMFVKYPGTLMVKKPGQTKFSPYKENI